MPAGQPALFSRQEIVVGLNDNGRPSQNHGDGTVATAGLTRCRRVPNTGFSFALLHDDP